MSNNANKLYTEERPWGNFTILDAGEGYKVKKLCINPHSRMSLQYHQKREEQWVVAQGEAFIIWNRLEETLGAGESIFIPLNTIHRIENKTDKPLIIIEVQIGDYLGEDDIIRLEDDFNRV